MAVDVLAQPPAGEDVDRLEAAADAEDGQAPLLGGVPRRALERVSSALDLVLAVDRLSVEGGIDVGTTGEEQAVHGRDRGSR